MSCPACGGPRVPGEECASFLCPAAAGSRRAIVTYLDTQLTADLAATAWTPTALVGLLLVLQGRPWLTPRRATILALLAVAAAAPLPVVLARKASLRGPEIPADRVIAMVEARAARKQSWLHEVRRSWSQIETYVTNPVLFGLLLAALARGLRRRRAAETILVGVLLVTSGILYLGPTRRLLPDPIPEAGAWVRRLEDDLARRGLPRETRVPIAEIDSPAPSPAL